jgi:hypothetical protein
LFGFGGWGEEEYYRSSWSKSVASEAFAVATNYSFTKPRWRLTLQIALYAFVDGNPDRVLAGVNGFAHLSGRHRCVEGVISIMISLYNIFFSHSYHAH